MELYTFRIDERLLLIFNLQMSHHPLDFVPCMDIYWAAFRVRAYIILTLSC